MYNILTKTFFQWEAAEHMQLLLGYIELGCANVEDINPNQMEAYCWPSELKCLIKISNIWTSNL